MSASCSRPVTSRPCGAALCIQVPVIHGGPPGLAAGPLLLPSSPLPTVADQEGSDQWTV
jgi:hypothetical protein